MSIKSNRIKVDKEAIGLPFGVQRSMFNFPRLCVSVSLWQKIFPSNAVEVSRRQKLFISKKRPSFADFLTLASTIFQLGTGRAEP